MGEFGALGAYSYCSHGNVTWPEQQISRSEGVEAIVAILAKQVLCRHDIENINTIYRATKNDQIVGLLQKKVEELHQEALKFQNGIFQEANRLGVELIRQLNWNQILQSRDNSRQSESDYAASALISLYQLQKVEVAGLNISQRFQEGRASFFKKNSQRVDVLAALLPCCQSGQHFEEDRRALLGSPPETSACEIADRSLERMLEAIFVKEEINFKQSQLAQEPHHPYFAQLLQKGYLKLFDYLREIQKFQKDPAGQQNYIEKIPFSQVSQVVLEARNAIMQSVEEAVNSSPDRQLVFLVGVTGTGKSATFCHLRGDTMKRVGDQFQSEQEPDLISEGDKSVTFFPNVASVGDMLIIDFPGFNDKNGPCVALGVEMALKALLRRYPAKVLLLCELIASTSERAIAFDALRKRLARLFQNSSQCVIGITKYSLENNYKEIAHHREMIRSAEERLGELNAEEERLQSSIKAIQEVCKANNAPALQSILSDRHIRFQELQTAKSNHLQLIQKHMRVIGEREPLLLESEETLLNTLGKSPENFPVIRLEDVSDPQAREGHLAALREAKVITAKESNSLDEKHQGYLQRRFHEQLVPELLSRPSYDLSGATEFQTVVLMTSLINALTLTTHPEIGLFLHAPEISRELVDGFDEKIVEIATERLIRKVVLDLDLPAYQLLLKDPGVIKEVDKHKREIVENLVADLSKTIVSLKSDDPSQSPEAAIKRVRESYLVSKRLGINREHAPTPIDPKEFSWVRYFAGVAIDSVSHIFQMAKTTNPFFDQLIDQLHKAQFAISSLRQLAVLVDKRRDIAQTFQLWAGVDWQETNWNGIIRTKIDAIEKMYGSYEWEKRLTELRLRSPQYGTGEQLHLLGAICMLIDDHMRFVVIENNRIIPALEAKAQQHHYRFFVRKEETRALILVDQYHYPLLIFDILVESLPSDLKKHCQSLEEIANVAPLLAKLVEVCTGKSIEAKHSKETVQLLLNRIEDVMQQVANTIHEEISQGQSATAISMMTSMVHLVAYTRQKSELDSFEKCLIAVSKSTLCDIAYVGFGLATIGFALAFGIKNELARAAFRAGKPLILAPVRTRNQIGAALLYLMSTTGIVDTPDRMLGHFLIKLSQLMDVTIFHEITQFASEFLQMDVDMPLFRALLADVYLEQAGL